MQDKPLVILEINAANHLSTGNIMMGIADCARRHGATVYTASKYTRQDALLEQDGRHPYHFFIGSRWENTLHRYFSWYTDFQDICSVAGTKKLIRKIRELSPDIIHLHDIVGWYLNIGILFRFLKSYGKPVIWTMHDCWAYTGRCIYYDMAQCDKWKSGCGNCPQKEMYPYSKVFDHSKWNYQRKRRLFQNVDNLTIVTPSQWLADEVKQSFMKDYPVQVIHNGIDLDVFRPTESDVRAAYGLENKKIVLAVASAWNERKGLSDLYRLQELLPDRYQVVLAGLTPAQKAQLPRNIVGITRTENVQQLAGIYTAADVFVNPTKDEVFGLVNVEALACGTPVVTYATGGSPECIDSTCGVVVEKGNIQQMADAVVEICKQDKNALRDACVLRSKQFDRDDKFDEYYRLYRKVAQEQS